MSSIYNPSSSRCITPTPALLNIAVNNDFKDDDVFNDNDNETKMTEDYSSTDNRDATDLDDDLNP